MTCRLLGPVPPDAVPLRQPNETDPRGDGEPSQGMLTLSLPEVDGVSRDLGVVLDSEGHLFSVSDFTTRTLRDVRRGSAVAREQAVAEFGRDGQGVGYFASAELADGIGSGEGTNVPYRALTATEIETLRLIAGDLMRRSGFA